jgi:hypothetical protein
VWYDQHSIITGIATKYLYQQNIGDHLVPPTKLPLSNSMPPPSVSLSLSLSTQTHTQSTCQREIQRVPSKPCESSSSSSSTVAWGKTHTHIHCLSHILLAKAKQMGRRDYSVEPYYLRRPNASISQILCLATASSELQIFLPSVFLSCLIPLLLLHQHSLALALRHCTPATSPPLVPLSSSQPLYTHAPNIYFAYSFLR